MSRSEQSGAQSPEVAAGDERPRLVLLSRGDALTPHLLGALREKYSVDALLDGIDLTTSQRLAVALNTFRPNRSRWAERYFKSDLGFRLRSANASARLREHGAPEAAVLQVHALFEVHPPSAIIYVDCTHRQSAELWPAWNPLQGNALHRWYERERQQYQDAAHLFAFSDWTRRSLVDDYGVDEDRVTVVGIGANFPVTARVARLPDSAPTILMVGNDFVRKGGLVLLEAFEAVRERMPAARLVLAGTTPPVRSFPDGVEVHGRVHDRARVAELFADADVFAMPSYFDPLPHAVLEAMSQALPVVAANVCAMPELVQDGVTGHLVEGGDPAGLADALVRVLTSPGRGADLGRQGQLRMREAFGWEHVVERMSPVLDQLLT